MFEIISFFLSIFTTTTEPEPQEPGFQANASMYIIADG